MAEAKTGSVGKQMSKATFTHTVTRNDKATGDHTFSVTAGDFRRHE